jgi:mRNA-degrading endonuclease toxin of MazEF toxin-antitoxin module
VSFARDIVDEAAAVVDAQSQGRCFAPRAEQAAPETMRIRSVPSELPVGPEEGLPHASVASFDNLRPFPKTMLVRRLGTAAPARRSLLCAVGAATLDC